MNNNCGLEFNVLLFTTQKYKDINSKRNGIK